MRGFEPLTLGFRNRYSDQTELHAGSARAGRGFALCSRGSWWRGTEGENRTHAFGDTIRRPTIGPPQRGAMSGRCVHDGSYSGQRGESQTRNRPIRSRMLYSLSYALRLVDGGGLDPQAFRLDSLSKRSQTPVWFAIRKWRRVKESNHHRFRGAVFETVC